MKEKDLSYMNKTADKKNADMVSVIIPVYNGVDYVSGIFDDLKSQSYKMMEVIFIDDGSVDNSAEIIGNAILETGNTVNRDKEDTSYIKYRYIHQANAGQGNARNHGIEVATGKYIIFLDHDDHIKDDYIERLVEAAEETSSDIVISGYERVSLSGEILERIELINSEWCRFMLAAPWGKIFRRDFIIRNNIRFISAVLGEDIYFNVLCFSHTDRVSFTAYVGYQWVQNESSLSNTVHRYVGAETDIVKLFETMRQMDGADIWMKEPDYEYLLLKTGLYHLLYVARNTPVRKLISYRNSIFAWLKRYFPGIERNKLIGWNKPAGERESVRHIVFFYMMLRRLHLDGIFLRLFHFLPFTE